MHKFSVKQKKILPTFPQDLVFLLIIDSVCRVKCLQQLLYTIGILTSLTHV